MSRCIYSVPQQINFFSGWTSVRKVYVHVYTCMYIHTHIYIYIYIYLRICMNTYVHEYVHLYIWIYIYVYAWRRKEDIYIYITLVHVYKIFSKSDMYIQSSPKETYPYNPLQKRLTVSTAPVPCTHHQTFNDNVHTIFSKRDIQSSPKETYTIFSTRDSTRD